MGVWLQDVGLWLEEINLGGYRQVFEDNGVNGEYLESLSMFTTEQILRFIRRCHMKWGDFITLCKELRRIKGSVFFFLSLKYLLWFVSIIIELKFFIFSHSPPCLDISSLVEHFVSRDCFSWEDCRIFTYQVTCLATVFELIIISDNKSFQLIWATFHKFKGYVWTYL